MTKNKKRQTHNALRHCVNFELLRKELLDFNSRQLIANPSIKRKEQAIA